MPLGCLSQNTEATIDPQGIIASNFPVRGGGGGYPPLPEGHYCHYPFDSRAFKEKE